MKSKIFLITGPAGAGKSTIANILAEKFEKSVVIGVDEIRHLIKRGMTSPASYTPESELQVELSVKNASALAKNFITAGFNVVIDDVVESKENLDLYFELLDSYNVSVFLLLPDKNSITKRDLSRPKNDQMKARALELHDKLTHLSKQEDRWHVIDSTNQTPQETLEKILKFQN